MQGLQSPLLWMTKAAPLYLSVFHGSRRWRISVSNTRKMRNANMRGNYSRIRQSVSNKRQKRTDAGRSSRSRRRISQGRKHEDLLQHKPHRRHKQHKPRRKLKCRLALWLLRHQGGLLPKELVVRCHNRLSHLRVLIHHLSSEMPLRILLLQSLVDTRWERNQVKLFRQVCRSPPKFPRVARRKPQARYTIAIPLPQWPIPWLQTAANRVKAHRALPKCHMEHPPCPKLRRL